MITANAKNRVAAVALNKEFKLPEDGYFHIAKKGEFPATIEVDGKEMDVIQVVDDKAIANMVTAFNAEAEKPDFAGLLVDRDHLSHDEKNSTESEGWIEKVEVRNNTDLYSNIRLSDLGAADIKGGRYRFISSEWDVTPIGQKDFTEGCRVRPIRLTGAGLTNRPNIKGLAALSNREKTLRDNPANSHAEQADIEQKNKSIMKSIAAKLGLSADASEDSIIGAIAKIENRATEAEGKLKPISEKLATVENRLKETEEASADAELDAAGIPADHADRAVIKTTLIANREGGRAMLKLVKPAGVKPAGQTRVTNRETAKTPTGAAIQDETANNGEAEAKAARVSNRAREIQATAKTSGQDMHWSVAFSKAQSEVK